MTETTGTLPSTGPAAPRPYADVLADAIAVLTEAARLTWSRDVDGETVTGRSDWAEFVALAAAAAAANVGGVEIALAGRPGSWEADFVRQLLVGTVGHDEAGLLEHRTEPVVVELYVDDILADSALAAAYDRADAGLASNGGGATIAELDRLEELRAEDWAAYGAALKANVEAAAARRGDLRVPVIVNVHLDEVELAAAAGAISYGWVDIAEELREAAVLATELPGGGIPPLERLRNIPPPSGAQ